jgi:hypothetical protein
MGSKSQRQKQRYEQKRNAKLKRQARKRQEDQKRQNQLRARQDGFDRRSEIAVGSNARHRQRLAQQTPQAWPSELPADVAIFDDAALAALPAELIPQATAIREALQEALASRGDDALKRVSEIPRGSPLSEWRLFIRGLIDWLANETAAAGEAWKRLDRERRPGRIATAMMLAFRSDLEQAIPSQDQTPATAPTDPTTAAEAQTPATSAWDRFDAAQLYHAKLLRRVRFDRAALRVAEAGLKIPEESKELLLGPRRIQWLARFIAEYGDTEPDLAAALAQTALRRAFGQNFSNLFDDAARRIPGPRHDRLNRLLAYHYYSRFSDDFAAQKAERALKEYLDHYLPKNEALPAPVREAIASLIHLNEANALMVPPEARGVGIFRFLYGAEEDSQAIRKHLLAAGKLFPSHSEVYQAHASWINSKLDDDRLKKPERTRLEEELADVMQSWSKGVPDEPEPRLWLVDHLLENEQLDEARPHVDFLAASRQENPRVRATPWKWQLLEAMRLCRRKAWLPEVPARLDEAEKLWPAWLSKQWLPYLRAAWTLRTRKLDAFEDERRRICEEAGRVRDSLADACLMLGAAQMMRATTEELKPLRETADRALKQVDSLPLADLFETGSFFWDLHRVQLVYPAYRLQGKTIGKTLFSRLEKNGKSVLDGIDDERVHGTVLWGSEYRFWANSYDTKLPAFFSKPAIQRHPAFVAAKLHAFLKQRYPWGVEKYQELGPLLRAAAPQQDAFYRHWYVALANQLDDLMAKQSRRFSRSLFGFGGEEADDDGLNFDPNCNCPDCQAARKAHEQAAAKQARSS